MMAQMEAKQKKAQQKLLGGGDDALEVTLDQAAENSKQKPCHLIRLSSVYFIGVLAAASLLDKMKNRGFPPEELRNPKEDKRRSRAASLLAMSIAELNPTQPDISGGDMFSEVGSTPRGEQGIFTQQPTGLREEPRTHLTWCFSQRLLGPSRSSNINLRNL